LAGAPHRDLLRSADHLVPEGLSDQAAFAGLASPAPAGLSTLSGIQSYVNVAAGWVEPDKARK
jgi:hypothetical protein